MFTALQEALEILMILFFLRLETSQSQNPGDNDLGSCGERELLKELKQDMLELKEKVGRLERVISELEQKVTSLVDEKGKPRDCADIKAAGYRTNGVYTVYVDAAIPAQVYCDMTTDGGGWLVFQRRQDGSENFYRNWTDYVVGFGNPASEFWLGNEKLLWMTNIGITYSLRIDLEEFDGSTAHAEYSNFRIGSAAEKYKLASLGSYSGTAGDSLTSTHLGHNFSTPDEDNDDYSGSCAVEYKGAWWYNKCHHSNLNGKYFPGREHRADGIIWYHWTRGYHTLKFTEMKMRPN